MIRVKRRQPNQANWTMRLITKQAADQQRSVCKKGVIHKKTTGRPQEVGNTTEKMVTCDVNVVAAPARDQSSIRLRSVLRSHVINLTSFPQGEAHCFLSAGAAERPKQRSAYNPYK